MSRATVVERKDAFLRQQKQILAQGLTQSKRLTAIADQSGIPQKVWIDVMRKVDRDLKRHSREVHSRQMTNHVIEQIDLLYWEAGAPSLESDADVSAAAGIDDNNTLYQGDDLTLDKNISKLPSSWDASEEQSWLNNRDSAPVDQDMYMDAAARLHDLSAKRLTLQQKLTTYRTLLSLLEPYRAPQENVQPNLVGRDAPLAIELTKTRTLAIRVAGRVGERFGDVQVPATAEDDEEMEEDGANAKLNRVLAGW